MSRRAHVLIAALGLVSLLSLSPLYAGQAEAGELRLKSVTWELQHPPKDADGWQRLSTTIGCALHGHGTYLIDRDHQNVTVTDADPTSIREIERYLDRLNHKQIPSDGDLASAWSLKPLTGLY